MAQHNEEWAEIQKSTFTRWVNQHLSVINKSINDLGTDFSNGVHLIELVEVLTKHKFPKANKNPRQKLQYMDNVSMVTHYLKTKEGINLVNINNISIVENKLTLIMGLVWKLILHYNISKVKIDGQQSSATDKTKSAEQNLQTWIRSKVRENIPDFHSSWNDGRFLGGLVDAIAPGLCPDWREWTKDEQMINVKETLVLADKYLGVGMLITEKELTDSKVDELSVMTYLCQFYYAKLKPGMTIHPKLKFEGQGLEPHGNQVGVLVRFTLKAFSGGQDKLEVIIVHSQGVTEQCTVEYNEVVMIYTCSYTPTMEGKYTVTIKYGGVEIRNSPFIINVAAGTGDASKVTLQGGGIGKTRVAVNEKMSFEVNTQSAGQGAVNVGIADASGRKDKVKVNVQPVKGKAGYYLVEFSIHDAGTYTISVFFAGQEIPNSPFTIQVGDSGSSSHESPMISKTSAGSGGMTRTSGGSGGMSQTSGGMSHTSGGMTHTSGGSGGMSQTSGGMSHTSGGSGGMSHTSGGSGGMSQTSGGMSHTSGGMTHTSGGSGGMSQTSGGMSHTSGGMTHTSGGSGGMSQTSGGMSQTSGGMSQTSGGMTRTSGGMTHTSGPAIGSGLSMGAVGETASFTLDSKTIGSGHMSMDINGPSRVEVKRVENQDGTSTFTYCPTAPGAYNITIKVNGKHIQGSPFTANIGCSGGMTRTSGGSGGMSQTSGGMSHTSGGMTHTSGGSGGMSQTSGGMSHTSGGSGGMSHTSGGMSQTSGGMSHTSGGMTHTSGGSGGMSQTSGGMSHTSGGMTHTSGGSGGMSQTSGGMSQTSGGMSQTSGGMTRTSGGMTYTSGPAIGSGLSMGAVGETASFTLDSKTIGSGHMSMDINGPSRVEVKRVENQDGTSTFTYCPTAPGAYNITIKVNGKHIQGSPFTANIGSTTGSSQYAMTSSSSGGGLPQIKVTEEDLSLYTITAISPSGEKVPCRLTRRADGFLNNEFLEVGKGTYTVSVYRSGQLVTKEPFKVTVSEDSGGSLIISAEGEVEVTGVRREMMTRTTTTTSSSQMTMSGHGAGGSMVGASNFKTSGEGTSMGFCNKVNTFSVSTPKAGNTMMLVGMMGPEVPMDELIVKFVGHGEYTISYKVKVKGQYTLVVRWGDHDIPGSPFHVTVQ